MALTLTDGERDILAELNEDAFADALAEWDDLTEEEQEEAREQARRDTEAAAIEPADYWAPATSPVCGLCDYQNGPRATVCAQCGHNLNALQDALQRWAA